VVWLRHRDRLPSSASTSSATSGGVTADTSAHASSVDALIQARKDELQRQRRGGPVVAPRTPYASGL
jgi:hypothetical protein